MKSSNCGFAYKTLILPVAIAAVLSVLINPWALLVALPILIVAVNQIRQMMQIRTWLGSGAPRTSAPDLSGIADEIVSSICAQKQDFQKQQESLSELLSRFDAATTAMLDALIIIDANGVIEWCNPAAGRLLGINAERDIGIPVENIVRNPMVAAYLNGGDYTNPLEFSVRSADGTSGVLRVVRYGENKRLLSVQDHSDMLRLQQVRSSFVSNASHEMRTPLTVIIGYLEVLITKTEFDPAMQGAVQSALEQAQRLQSLVEDLLSLTRLENAPLQLEDLDRLQIGGLVNKALETIQSSSQYTSRKVSVSLCAQDEVLGSYRELLSAVSNVIENAFKHTQEEAEIDIELSREGEWLVLRVADQGQGIEAEHIHRLTERFYRVDTGRSRERGGTGLGLSIVKHIMSRHEGELSIQSEPGRGSVFALRFKPI